jgi:NADH:ubiquinone oxidoreductase subunit E
VAYTWRVIDSEGLRESVSNLAANDSVLLALQTIQATFGHVPDEALEVVADVCNVSRAEVYGVLTFYRDLRTTPPASNVVRVCVAEACQASGSDTLVRALSDEMGLDVLAASRRGEVEVAPVYCLGNCALGPAALVNDRLLGRATVATIRSALGDAS